MPLFVDFGLLCSSLKTPLPQLRPLQVMVVRKKDTQRVYAMKVLSKQHLKDRGEIEHTISERRILEKHNSPFLVSLKFSFQTPEKVRRGEHTSYQLSHISLLFLGTRLEK